jgi:uncharacterized protein YeaO (DUF488 family)
MGHLGHAQQVFELAPNVPAEAAPEKAEKRAPVIQIADGGRSLKKKLKLSTFQIGAPARRGEGLRIGVTRRPPRGVPKSRWVCDGYFDVWLPTLAPSTKLLARFKKRGFDDPEVREASFDSYERELLSSTDGRQTVAFVAQVAARTRISIGCFCGDESRCHLSRLTTAHLRSR